MQTLFLLTKSFTPIGINFRAKIYLVLSRPLNCIVSVNIIIYSIVVIFINLGTTRNKMSKRKSDSHWSGYNRNYFKRLVKKQQEKFFEVVQNSDVVDSNLVSNHLPNEETEYNSDETEHSSESTSENEARSSFTEYISDFESDTSELSYPSSDEEENLTKLKRPVRKQLSDDLASLVVKKRWEDRGVNELLRVLNNHDVKNVPKTKDKLLSTPKEKINVRPIAGGSFHYYGIRKALLRRTHLLKDLDHIEIDIGIDGARLYHSSPLQIWPSIASVANCSNIRPFLIGKISN